MAITIASNFELASRLPLDNRYLVVNDVSLTGIPNQYSGMIAFSMQSRRLFYLETVSPQSWVSLGSVTNVVTTTGNQIISGDKTFSGRLILNNGSGAMFRDASGDFYGLSGINTGFYGSGLSLISKNREVARLYNNGNIALDDFNSLPGAGLNNGYKIFHMASNTERGNPMISMASRNLHTIFLGNNSGQFILGYENFDPNNIAFSGRRPIGWLFQHKLNYSDQNPFNAGATVFFVDARTGYLSGQSGYFVDNSGNTSLNWNARALSGNWSFNNRPNVNNSGVVLEYVDINNLTANFSLQSGWNGRLLSVSGSSNITGTVPSGLPVGYNVALVQIGNGLVVVTGAAGVQIRQKLNLNKTSGPFSVASLVHRTNNEYLLYGDLI